MCTSFYENLRRLGLLGHLERRRALAALPRLVEGGIWVEFALVDSDHKYDSVFVNFIFCDLLLEQGGHIFDDAWMRSVQPSSPSSKPTATTTSAWRSCRPTRRCFARWGAPKGWDHFEDSHAARLHAQRTSKAEP